MLVNIIQHSLVAFIRFFSPTKCMLVGIHMHVQYVYVSYVQVDDKICACEHPRVPFDYVLYNIAVI